MSYCVTANVILDSHLDSSLLKVLIFGPSLYQAKPVNDKHFLNAFTVQIRLVSNQKLTRIQRRANRRLQSKVFGFWEKYENC